MLRIATKIFAIVDDSTKPKPRVYHDKKENQTLFIFAFLLLVIFFPIFGPGRCQDNDSIRIRKKQQQPVSIIQVELSVWCDYRWMFLYRKFPGRWACNFRLEITKANAKKKNPIKCLVVDFCGFAISSLTEKDSF